MVLGFSWLPPEINSARMFAGAGSGPLFAAASAWEGLAADLWASASSFESVLAALTTGPWTGPASMSMAAAASPYVGWLSTVASQAQLAAIQARAAATAFEAALAATVHPTAVTANQVSLASLIAANVLGQNTPAIAATEFDYLEMWAQDVAAMVGYHAGAKSVAATLAPFSLPPVSLAGLAAQVGTQVAGMATTASAAVTPVVEGAMASVPTVMSGMQSLVSQLPLQHASMLFLPVRILTSPITTLASMARESATRLGPPAGGLAAANTPNPSGAAIPAFKPLGGRELGAGMSAGLGQAQLVGSMSVPPTWQGSIPISMASSAMSGLGVPPNPVALTQAAGAAGGGMPMMLMPMSISGAGAGMPGGLMDRDGAGWHVTQARLTVIPRTGVG